MSFFFKSVLTPAILACLGVGLWKLHDYVNSTPKLLDQIVASGLKPITYSKRNHLEKYHDRILKYKSELSTDFPHLSFDLNNSYESSAKLRNLCLSTLRKEFNAGKASSKRDLKLAVKYCTMSLKDQILEAGNIRLLGDDSSVNSYNDYLLIFNKNKQTILEESKKYQSSELLLDDIDSSDGGIFLESWCNKNLEKPYLDRNYRLFSYVKNWCATPDPLF